MPYYIQLGPNTVYLPSGDIVNNSNGHKDEFTISQLKLFLSLLEKGITAPHSYLPTWYLARSIFPDNYSKDRDKAIHAVEQHISNMRKKLEESGKPRYLLGGRKKGYRLYLPKGCCAVPIEVLRKLFNILNRR